MAAEESRRSGGSTRAAPEGQKERTTAGIYGVIVSAAVMASSHADSAVALALAVLVTLVIYWAAERYARLLAERIHEGHRPSWAQVRHQLTTGWTMVTASAVPLVVLAALTLLGVPLRAAVFLALACSTALLCVAGWQMGRRGELSTRERIVSSAVAGAFGLVMVVLKAALH